MTNIKVNKLWGTAFSKKPKEQVVLFCAGRDIQAVPPADEVLIPYEVKASSAWVKMLFDENLIDKNTLAKLLAGLKEILKLWQKGQFKLNPLKEDVHTNVESYLIEKYGINVGGKIHTGRSRNEQIIADMILYLKDSNDIYKKEIKNLIKVLSGVSQKYQDYIIPGYTHHQHATVTTFGQMLDAYKQILLKDLKKFASWNDLEEFSPLGSSAGYGTSLNINKYKVNKYLGLKKVFVNEIAAVTFKGDAEIYLVYNICTLLNHLSSLAQTLILFSTKEFGFLKISDEYSTGSSIMPQKKNPDPLEVIKAKASMCHGYLTSLLSLTKAPFIGFNRDLQWIKYITMDAVNETLLVPKIIAGVLTTMTVNKEIMAKWTTKGFILAQAIMEGLIKDFNIPMRLAKMIVETAVKYCEDKNTFDLNIINGVIKQFKLKIIISPQQFKQWTDSLTIAKLQMKKDLKEGNKDD